MMNYSEESLNLSSFVNASTTGDWGREEEEAVCVPGEEWVPVPIPPHVLREVRSWLPLRHITQTDVALKVTFYVLVMLVGVLGNGLVMVLVSVSRKMRTATNVLLVNLALADLLLCLLCMWLHLGNSLHQDWPFGPLLCKVNMFVQVMVITSSVLTLTVISVERFVAIVFPLHRTWSLRLTLVLIGIVWVIACSIASPQLYVRQLEQYQFSDRHVITCREQWPQIYINRRCHTWAPHKVVYHVLVGVVLFLLPIIIMVVCYTIICVSLLVRKTPGSSSSGQAKKKVVRMLVIVMVVFVVCWTPVHVLEIIPIFHPEKKATDEVVYAALFIGYTNSALNPIMYAGFNENFRRGFQEMFRRCCRPISSKTTRVQPQEPQRSCSHVASDYRCQRPQPHAAQPPVNHGLHVHPLTTSMHTNFFTSS